MVRPSLIQKRAWHVPAVFRKRFPLRPKQSRYHAKKLLLHMAFMQLSRLPPNSIRRDMCIHGTLMRPMRLGCQQGFECQISRLNLQAVDRSNASQQRTSTALLHKGAHGNLCAFPWGAAHRSRRRAFIAQRSPRPLSGCSFEMYRSFAYAALHRAEAALGSARSHPPCVRPAAHRPEAAFQGSAHRI